MGLNNSLTKQHVLRQQNNNSNIPSTTNSNPPEDSYFSDLFKSKTTTSSTVTTPLQTCGTTRNKRKSPENDTVNTLHTENQNHETSNANQNNHQAKFYKIIDEDLDRLWTQIVQSHTKNCVMSRLVPIESKYSICHGVQTSYKCMTCKVVLTKTSSKSGIRSCSSPGPVQCDLNRAIAAGFFMNGICLTKAVSILNYCGIMCFSKDSALRSKAQLKHSIHTSWKDESLLARKRHNAAVRLDENYEGDLKVSRNGKEHSFACGGVSADGAGDIRSYNNRHTGSQHVTTCISDITKETLCVSHHQTSCQKCSLKYTQVINQLKKEGRDHSYVQMSDMYHEGKCYRNTLHTPGTAEENGYEQIAHDLLLKDPKNINPNTDIGTAELCDDDVAILGKRVISDGDTTGSVKMMEIQRKILGLPSAEISSHEPGIEHVLSRISKNLHNLANKDTSLKGKNLLDSPRIKSIVNDISSHISLLSDLKNMTHEQHKREELTIIQYHEKIKFWNNSILKDIYNIIHHHCGEHQNCNGYFCHHKQTKQQLKARENLFGMSFSHKDLNDISSSRAKFKGKVLAIEKGQAREKIISVIRTQINEDNIDKVSNKRSTNPNEHFNMMLSLLSGGKRVYLGQTDTWEANCHLVAGRTRSPGSSGFDTKVLKNFGLMDNTQRQQFFDRKSRSVTKDVSRKQSTRYKERRQMSISRKIKQLSRVQKRNDRYKSQKMSFTTRNGQKSQRVVKQRPTLRPTGSSFPRLYKGMFTKK